MSVKYQLFSMNAYIDGVIINDFVRLGKCIKELERIHGIRHGNNQHGERIGNGFQSSLTQEDLAKELGIKRIPGVMRDYLNEDEELKDLIETNLKQRVLGNDNPVKLGKCIKELERIHGIRHGGDWSEGARGNGFRSSLTQEDLAKELDQEAIGYAANYEATCYRINPDGTREMIYKPGNDDQNEEKPGRVGNNPKEGNGATWNQ